MSSNGTVGTVSPAKTIILKTSDNQTFEVEKSIAMEFVTLKTFFDDNNDADMSSTVVPLPNVTAKHLCLIISYCKENMKFRSESTDTEEKKAYEAKFVEELSSEDLKEILLAVNYLDIKSSLDMLTQAVADRIKNWSVEKVENFLESRMISRRKRRPRFAGRIHGYMRMLKTESLALQLNC